MAPRLPQLLPSLLSAFPILTDSAEFSNCYGFLASLFTEHPNLKAAHLMTPNILESLMEACYGSGVAKHLPATVRHTLQQYIGEVSAAIGPQASASIVSRFNTTTTL
jgi:hypothetical protein